MVWNKKKIIWGGVTTDKVKSSSYISISTWKKSYQRGKPNSKYISLTSDTKSIIWHTLNIYYT